MVPEFEEFLLPTLKVLADGTTLSVQQIREAVIAVFNFSDEELKERTRSGNNTKVNDRITWALTYLRQAGLVESPQRAYGQITFPGLELLENPPKVITRNFLYSKYPSFRDFNNRKRGQNKDNKNGNVATTPNKAVHDSTNSETKSPLVQTLAELRNAVETFRRLGFEPSAEQLEKIAEIEKQLSTETLFPAVAKAVAINAADDKFVIIIKYDNGRVSLHYDNSEEGLNSFPNDSETIDCTKQNDSDEGKTSSRKRRPNLNFYQMGLIAGDELTYKDDDNVRVTIASENRVEYQGKEYSLTKLTQELKGLDHAIQPTGEWEFDGQNLLDLYNETYKS